MKRPFCFLALALSVSVHAEEPLGEEELEERRNKLEAWTFEPVALDNRFFRLQMDRKDSSFFFASRRSDVKFYSSWHRRGFAAVTLANGETVPVDKVEDLHASGERIRFQGSSSVSALPPLFLEIVAGAATVTLRFEIPEESRGEIAAVRLLDGALWVADSDGGGVAVARGMGERLDVKHEGDKTITLDGLTFASGTKDSGAAYSIPVVAIEKGAASALLYWESPDATVEIDRRAVDDGRFPGRRGVFVSLTFRGHEGQAHVASDLEAEIGPLALSSVYRAKSERRFSSLRYKTSTTPALKPLLGAVFFRPSLTRPPAPPSLTGSVLYTFEDVARMAEHMKTKLAIDDAVFLLNDWLGSGPGDEAPLFSAAEECGGNPGLADCARRIKEKAGYVFGLALEREQLLRDHASERPRGRAAWSAALETARREKGFPALKELCSPQLLVVREPTGEGADSAILDARSAFTGYVDEVFSLWGTNLPSERDMEAAGYLENLFSSKTALPEFTGASPIFAAFFGHEARLTAAQGDGLRPNDAARVLTHLLFGEAPAFALPPRSHYQTDSDSLTPRSKESIQVGDGPDWCFARKSGWSEDLDLSPYDVFIKNVYELCSPVTEIQAREPLMAHRRLTEDGLVRETFAGTDMRILVNFGPENYEDEESDVLLPQYGFLIRHPYFLAFHALRVKDMHYETPAFFTVRSLEGKMYLLAEKTRIYHGFGPDKIRLGGRQFTVPRQAIVKIRK